MNRQRIHEASRARTIVAGCLGLAFLAATLSAQGNTVGLSGVGAQRFENEDLLFYEPETNDRFAYSLASGDFNGDGADDLATGMPFDDCLAGFGPVDCGSVVIRYGVPRTGLATGLADHILNQQGSGSPDQADEDDLFGRALAACDINGDGFDDLAVGIPGEDHLGESDAGAIQVYYGSSAGISNTGIVFYTQSTDGIPGNVEESDGFGHSLACGDFNGDSFADLAIGAPFEDIGSTIGAGMVIFIPGSDVGTRPDLATSLDQDSSGMDGSCEDTEFFAYTLAAGDFDADTFDDVAIGVLIETQGDVASGAVHMVWGGASGITSAGNFLFFESALGGSPESGDEFGRALAVGDFDGDGHDDLAIGVPFEDLGAFADTGNVGVVYGDPTGFNFTRSQGFDQDGILGAPSTESGDHFGFALASGDFDGDGPDDLAIGHPAEHYFGPLDGAVTVIMGASVVGLSPSRSRLFVSGLSGTPGDPGEHNKQFGFALAAGDFDGDRYADLAIGIPFDNEGGLTDVGAEIVLYGALFADGFETESTVMWSSAAP